MVERPDKKPLVRTIAWQCGVLAALGFSAVGGWLVAQGRLVLGTVVIGVAVIVLGMLWAARHDATRDAIDRVRKFIMDIIWWLPH